MRNERLEAAIERAGKTVEDVARATNVDIKTVYRWVDGRVPHPRTRFAVARFVGEDETFLWPDASRKAQSSGISEIVGAHAYRSEFPVAQWWDLIKRANRQIDLLGYTLYFLPMQHPKLIDEFEKKCREGCKIRAVIADPESHYVADRDEEEELDLTLVVRIGTSLKYFKPLLDCPNFELRFQDVPLYNSIFRFDDNMLVTPHLYATPGSSAPLFQFRKVGNEHGIFGRFESHFQSIWDRSVAHK